MSTRGIPYTVDRGNHNMVIRTTTVVADKTKTKTTAIHKLLNIDYNIIIYTYKIDVSTFLYIIYCTTAAGPDLRKRRWINSTKMNFIRFL